MNIQSIGEYFYLANTAAIIRELQCRLIEGFQYITKLPQQLNLRLAKLYPRLEMNHLNLEEQKTTNQGLHRSEFL